jgi:chondroitin AC lyase
MHVARWTGCAGRGTKSPSLLRLSIPLIAALALWGYPASGAEGQAPIATYAAANSAHEKDPPSADIALIKRRLLALYLARDSSKARQYLSAQSAEGAWPDINYGDRSVQWDPQKHLDRLVQMAVAYENGTSPDHHSVKMRQGIISGLSYWITKKPVSDSWWSNEIGQQLALAPILTLMDGDLPADVMQGGSAYLHDPIQAAALKPTGENLVWFAGEQLVRGVLTSSSEDIASAVRQLESVDTITTEEGIQPDHSFHQHGPQLYVGGYGLQLLKDSIIYARLVDGTRFAYAPETINVLTGYLFDGARLMVRGTLLDYGAIGREISRAGGGKEALGLIAVCDNLSALRPDRKSDCDALKAHIQGTGAAYSFLGHKHFWNSDFSVHQRQGYYASVKLASARTYGTEKVNNENLKGYWIPFGTSYLARRGDEYLDIFPVWDWAHLPGVTCPDEVPQFLSHVSQQGLFAGGVSDGKYGASAMQLDIQNAPSIHAHKAWFFFDDEIVALGAGISSSDNVAVNTTLNQSLLKGAVIADDKAISPGQHSLNATSWALHDGIGYVFPGKATVAIGSGPRTGSWSAINALESRAPVTKEVFTISVSHGVRPVNGNYQYIVVPGADAKRLNDYVGRIPVRILANTIEVQAVRHEQLGVSEIVFFSPGRLSLRPGLTISADQPCIILVEEAGDAVKLVVSTPRGPLQLHVALAFASGVKTAAFDLRGGPAMGASQVQTIKLP